MSSKRSRSTANSEKGSEIDPLVAVIDLVSSDSKKSKKGVGKSTKVNKSTPKGVNKSATKNSTKAAATTKSAPPKSASKKKKSNEGTTSTAASTSSFPETGRRSSVGARLDDLDYLGFPKSSSLKGDGDDSDSDVSMVSSVSSSTSGMELTFETGARCEARDYTGKWYPCKIIAIDWNRRNVKIHYEYWSAKFDQWMPMDTTDIRPPQAPSRRGQQKPSRAFKPGDKVHARWSDGRKYPAKILNKANNGMYEVLFFDGFKKAVSEKRLEFMTPSEANKVKFSSSPVLAPVRSQLGPVAANAAAKAVKEKPVERPRETSSSNRRKRTLTDKGSEFFGAKKPRLEKCKDEDEPKAEESVGPWRFIPVQRESRLRANVQPVPEKKQENETENVEQLAAIDLLSPLKKGRKRNDSDVSVELADLVDDGKKSSEAAAPSATKISSSGKSPSSEGSSSNKKQSGSSKSSKAEVIPSKSSSGSSSEKGKRSVKVDLIPAPTVTSDPPLVTVADVPPVVELESEKDDLSKGVIDNVDVIENVDVIKMVEASGDVQDCDEVRVSLSIAGQQALIEKDNIPLIQIEDEKEAADDAPYVIPLFEDAKTKQESPTSALAKQKKAGTKKSKEVKWSDSSGGESEVLRVNVDDVEKDASIQAQVVVKSTPMSPRAATTPPEPTKRSARIRSKSGEQDSAVASPTRKVEVVKKPDVKAVEENVYADSAAAKKKASDWTVAHGLQDHHAFKCPKEGCWKGFRKEDLLQMHIKHYHPEYTKYVSKAPKVIQLAARLSFPDEPAPASPEVQPSYIKKIAQIEAKKTKKETPVKATPPTKVKSDPQPEQSTSKTEPAPVTSKIEKKKEKERLNREVHATLEDVVQTMKKADDEAISTVEEKSSGEVKKKSISAFIHEELRKEAQWRSQKAKEKEEQQIKEEPKAEEKPKVEKVEKVEKIEKPKVEKIEKPKVEKIEKPKVEKIEKPKIEKTDKVKQEKIRKSKRLRSISQGEDDEEWTSEPKKKGKEADKKRKRNITESSEEELNVVDGAAKSLKRKDEVQQEAKKMRLDSASTDSSRRDTEDVQTDDAEQGWEDNIIFCSCGSNEDEGLMIQCELCLTWQHGACHDIDTNEQVPEKYICSKCLHPELQRESARYLHRQEWITEGKLARFEFIEGNAPAKNMEVVMKRSHDLCGSVLNLRKVVKSLRQKLKIAGDPNNPKMVQWAKPWDPPPTPTTSACSQLETSIAELPIPTLGPVKLNLEELMGDIMNTDFHHFPAELPQNGDKASDLNLPPIKEEPLTDNAPSADSFEGHLDAIKAEDVPAVSAQEDVTEVEDETQGTSVQTKIPVASASQPVNLPEENVVLRMLKVDPSATEDKGPNDGKTGEGSVKIEVERISESTKEAEKPQETVVKNPDGSERQEGPSKSSLEKDQLEMDIDMVMQTCNKVSKECKAEESGIQQNVPDDKDLIVEEVLKLQGVTIKKEPTFNYEDSGIPPSEHSLEAWTAGNTGVLDENEALVAHVKDDAMMNVDDIPLDDLLRDTDALELSTPSSSAHSSVVPRPPVNFPVPEKVIDFLDCRINLLEHIENLQNQVDSRLDWIESQLSALENADENLVSSASVWDSRMVNTVLRDLATVRKIASLTPKS